MTREPPRISDPSTVLLRLDQARYSLDSLDELTAELVGAKRRLAELETRLRTEVERAAGISERAEDAAADAAARLASELAGAKRVAADVTTRAQQNEERLEREVSRVRESVDSHVTKVSAQIDDMLVAVDKALSEVERASSQLHSDAEGFRRQQLTKLDDLQTTYRLLSDRQREHEERAQRDRAADQERIDSLANAIRGDLAEHSDRLQDGLDAFERAHQRAESELARHARAISQVRRAAWATLGFTMLAIVSFGGLVAYLIVNP